MAAAAATTHWAARLCGTGAAAGSAWPATWRGPSCSRQHGWGGGGSVGGGGGGWWVAGGGLRVVDYGRRMTDGGRRMTEGGWRILADGSGGDGGMGGGGLTSGGLAVPPGRQAGPRGRLPRGWHWGRGPGWGRRPAARACRGQPKQDRQTHPPHWALGLGLGSSFDWLSAAGPARTSPSTSTSRVVPARAVTSRRGAPRLPLFRVRGASRAASRASRLRTAETDGRHGRRLCIRPWRLSRCITADRLGGSVPDATPAVAPAAHGARALTWWWRYRPPRPP